MSRCAIVITFDHLHLGYLGCYGNDWMETPNLDRLATKSVVFDRHFAENLDPAAVNHAWWTGRNQALVSPDARREEPTFLADLERAGVRASLIAEADGRDSSIVAPPFDELIEVRGTDSLEGSEQETPFARLVLRTVQWLQANRGDERPRLLWVKSRGVPVPWLPPRGFADLYLDEFGLGGHSAAPDDTGEHEDDDDPIADALHSSGSTAPGSTGATDQLLELKYARAMYAAYVTWLDRWFGKLLSALEKHPAWNEMLLIVTAAAGTALGEHGGLDEHVPTLREEHLHTPLFVRVPGGLHDTTRRAALVQPVDVAATLLEWFDASPPLRKGGAGGGALQADPCENAGPAVAVGPVIAEPRSIVEGQSLLPMVRNEREAVRDAALLHSGAEWGLRTDDFLYVESKTIAAADDSTTSEVLLFEKPYDRWDHADVSSQYPQVLEDLRDRLLKCRRVDFSPPEERERQD